MALDPKDNPKGFLILIIAAGMKIFANKPWSNKEYFEDAEKFVEEAERLHGKIE